MPLVLRPPTEERASLPTRLAALGRSRKWVSLACGVFALTAAVLAAVLVACALDAWLHLPPLPRAVALVGTLTAAGVIWVRSLAPALRLPTAPLAVALDLETRFPPLNDSLASAVSFLADPARDEDRGVSRRLRIAAVRRAERMAERHDFGRLVPVGRCWRLFWTCAFVVCVAAPLGLWNQARTATAVTRLADPFGAHPWPAKTRVEILLPQQFPARLPKGDVFELRFVVRGEIPDRAAVSFQVAGGDEFEEVYPLAKADPRNPAALPPGVSATGGPVAVVGARLDPNRLAQSFQFRVRANDADTGWQRVHVVPPPRLVPLDGRATPQIGVTPPAYIGARPFDLPDGAAVIEVPLGTVVSLRAAADVRLAAATLTFQGDRSAVERASGFAHIGWLDPAAALGAQLLADAVGADVPLALSGDGKVMGVTFTPSMSGMYALKLTDDTGLVGTRLLEIRLTPDPVPLVSLMRPAVGRDPPMVVPGAVVTVHVAIEDKVYAIRHSFLEYRVGRDGRVRTIPLPDARATVVGAAGLLHPVAFESRVVMPVSRFTRDDGTPVRDGDTIFLRAAADDWDDVTVLKEPGRSGEVEIRVSSRESVEGFLQKELAAMRPDLQRAREQQRDATARTADAKPQPDGTLSPADREKLMGAEQSQRHVQSRVAAPGDGLRAKAEMLRELARVNGLPKSNTTDRLEAVADELGRLADRDLSAVGPLLGDARQQSAQPPKPGQEQVVPQMLTRVGRHQKTIEDGLTNLIDLLSQWGGAAEIRGDARMLRDAVQREAGNADKLREKVQPGKAPEALPPDQRAELDRAGAKLELLADQTSGLLSRAAKFAAEKETQAADTKAAADKKEREADDLKKKALALPPGTPDRTSLEAKAAVLAEEAAEMRAAGAKAQAEADALNKAVKDAGGQALPDELRKAADAARANRLGETAGLDRSAAARLDRLANGLTEKPTEDVPELARKKKSADQLDALAAAQDDLRKRAADAARIKDADKRAGALKRLAPEQEKLIDRTRDLVQRLTRERAEDAAKDGRAALDKMEAARDDLERGDDPTNAQADATAKLDEARDKLDTAVAQAPQELSDEKRRKLTDLVKGLLERQKAAVAEAARVQEEILKAKKWPRPLLTSYRDLEDRERALAPEVRALADREFAELPVFARVVKDAADGLEKAAERAKVRWQDARDADPDAAFDADLEKANDARVRRPMDLAVRRLEQVLDVLKPDTAKKDEKKPAGPPPGGPMPPMPMAGGGGTGEVIPPLAQLKALRSLQAELNQRTAEFDKLHPDRGKLSDEDREDLKDLEDAQREITVLFEQMAQLFQQKDTPPGAKPEEKP